MAHVEYTWLAADWPATASASPIRPTQKRSVAWLGSRLGLGLGLGLGLRLGLGIGLGLGLGPGLVRGLRDR